MNTTVDGCTQLLRRWRGSIVWLVLALLLTSGGMALQASAGLADSGVTIVGEVYLDMNADRVRQPGEPGVQGAEIQVLDQAGRPIASTRSDREGYYVIGGLAPALYTVTVQPPRGYIVLDNGAAAYRATEVQAPVLVSTPIRRGLFLPLVRAH